MHAHLVFLTRKRGAVFSKRHLSDLERLLRRVCRGFGAQLVEFEGQPDHVRLLVSYPPTLAVSRLVNSLKGASSHRLRRQHANLAAACGDGGLWSRSYFASGGDAAPVAAMSSFVCDNE